MSKAGYDPIKPWYLAVEATGEFIGMRFARIPPGKTEPDWIYVRHCDYDGIGAIKMMFAERGGHVELPEAKHPARPSWRSIFPLLKMQLQPRRKLKWKNLGPTGMVENPPKPALAAAWHVFTEEKTAQIRRHSSASGATVNSFLLEQLTKILRPYLENGGTAEIPWMIPVNMRGRVTSSGELANQTSYLSVTVKPADTVRDIHQSTGAAMDRGDHCTNWFAFDIGKSLPQWLKNFLIDQKLVPSPPHLGAFSNLGVWDAEKKITSPGCVGDWLVSPPVLRWSLFGAGCMTFQNRLTLLTQAHPELTTDAGVCRKWIQEWVKAIETDLAKPVSPPSPAAPAP
jgi:NRPS condensation-like uncharacterized protein